MRSLPEEASQPPVCVPRVPVFPERAPLAEGMKPDTPRPEQDPSQLPEGEGWRQEKRRRKGDRQPRGPRTSAKVTWSPLDKGTHSTLSSRPDGTALWTSGISLGWEVLAQALN